MKNSEYIGELITRLGIEGGARNEHGNVKNVPEKSRPFR